jgi:hypothetical protein
MQFRALPLLLTASVLSALASGQSKISGTVKCVRPDQSQKIAIGDRPNHSFAISQGKCTWIKPMTIADIETKEDIGTNSEETTSAGARVRGYVVGTMSNGDKFTARTFAHDVYKGGNLQSTQGTWNFTSGTGKLKGIKGGGAFTGQPDSDGSVIVEVVGQYTLPKKP